MEETEVEEMTISDAIKHYEQRAKEYENVLNAEPAVGYPYIYFHKDEVRERLAETKQMVGWLKELKGYRLAYSQIQFNAKYYAGGRGEAFETSASIIEDKIKKEKSRGESK